jgi:hypothetical protein
MMAVNVSALPRSPGASLDDLLSSRFLPKQWVGRIWAASELPTRLEGCVRNLVPNAEWRAYSDEGRIFFAVARRHAALTRAASAEAIDVYFLDSNAAVYSAAVWEYDCKHGWWLDAILDVSYDCDHGWWPDVLMDPQTPTNPRAAAMPSGPLGCRRITGPSAHPMGTSSRKRPAKRRKVSA